MNYDESIDINDFSIMKNNETGHVALFFDFSAEWEITDTCPVIINVKDKQIIIFVIHDEVITKITFSGFEDSIKTRISLESIRSLILKDEFSIFSNDDGDFCLIPISPAIQI